MNSLELCHVLHFLVLIWYISGTKDFDNGFFQYTRVFYPMVLDVEVEKLLKHRKKIEYRKITGL